MTLVLLGIVGLVLGGKDLQKKRSVWVLVVVTQLLTIYELF